MVTALGKLGETSVKCGDEIVAVLVPLVSKEAVVRALASWSKSQEVVKVLR